uniref:Uncharacterized protein n=1 Tax=Vespula pensylvanica TaxID=30213 RepID=A0A834NXG5_VESPE|nr:hypothetical protein H0235_010311 [Vespula pensylvanica]
MPRVNSWESDERVKRHSKEEYWRGEGEGTIIRHFIDTFADNSLRNVEKTRGKGVTFASQLRQRQQDTTSHRKELRKVEGGIARRRSIYLTATYGAHPEARPTKIPAACSSIHIDEELRVRDYGVGVQAIKDVPRTTRRGPTAQEGRGESRGRRSQRTVKDDVWPDPLPLNFFASLCKKLTDTLHRSNSENYAEVFETQGRQLTTRFNLAVVSRL